MPFFNARTSKIDTNVVVSVTSDISSAFCLLHGFVIVTHTPHPPKKEEEVEEEGGGGGGEGQEEEQEEENQAAT